MSKIKVAITRIDKDLPLPKYQTVGSVAFDLLARDRREINSFEVSLIPLNVIIKIPKGYGLFLVPRSSTPRKKGLIVPHGIGIIDQDYCGDHDELMLQVMNFTKEKVIVERGERIAQAIFVKIGIAEFSETESHGKKSRGGFGSTG